MDPCLAEARETLRLLSERKLSARELMAAHLARIRAVNPKLNAIVSKLADDECLALAAAADEQRARGGTTGALAGLPWAFKDVEEAVGLRCTYGSPIFRDYQPTEDTVLVSRLRAAGVIPIGKTNVPEFGMGSHTYNRVYGPTRNPYDPSRSAGGSSGGAAVAVATGMLPLADGSDLGGSLRNPANFNNVVGLRPSVGLVPLAPTSMPLLGFLVKGPLARSVSDAALLLAVIAGEDPRDPGSWPSQPASFAQPLAVDVHGARVAWSPDLGCLPLDPAVREVVDRQRKVLEDLGCEVEEAAPELADADAIFLTLRRWRSWAELGALLESHRADLKPEAIAEIEAGRRLTSAEVATAFKAHAALLARMRRFNERYEFLVSAVNQVAPFELERHWPTSIAGVPMDHYVAWMKSAYWITTTWAPAISVPAGFTPEGLPVGLQITGRWRADRRVLEMAYAFEQATGVGQRRPPLAAG